MRHFGVRLRLCAVASTILSFRLLSEPSTCAISADRPVPGQSPECALVVEVRSAGYPVPGALVRAGSREARTDSSGRARLALPAGTHTVTVVAEGFLPAQASFAAEPGVEGRLAVELAPRLEIREEVIVTATRSNRRLEEQPVRVEVVDREEIEEKALMTPGSVAMLLGETTGLRIQTTSPSLGAANVRIQGLRGRYSQLLSDGLPLYGAQGDSFSLLQVPPLDLGQVEIIKGAASALYGPSALGGVVNLVSQRPTARRREFLLNRSSQEATDLSFWLAEPASRHWAYTLLGGVHGQLKQDLDSDGWSDLPGFARGVLRPRIFWEDGTGRSVFATIGVMAENREGGTLAGAAAPDRNPFVQSLDSRRIDGGAVSQIPVGRGRLLSLRGSVAYRGEQRRFGDVTERGRRLTWLSEAVLRGTSGRQSWVAGAAVEGERFSGLQPAGFDYSFVTPGFLAQDEIAIAGKLTVGLSARIDRHNRYGTFANPRLSLLYKPAPGWTARLSAGTGYFAPTPFTEETEETGLSRLRPPTNLVAEQARSASFDAGWSRGPVEVVATLYGSAIRHPIERRIVGTAGIELVNAGGPIRTWGTELIGRYRVEAFLIMFTHSYTRSTEQDVNIGGRREVPLTPANQASLNAIWESARFGRLGVEAYYTGRQPLDEDPYRSAGRGYLLCGLLYQRRFGRFHLFINFENFGNIRQTRYAPLVRPARAPDGRWTVDAWAPLDGRLVNGGFRLSLR